MVWGRGESNYKNAIDFMMCEKKDQLFRKKKIDLHIIKWEYAKLYDIFVRGKIICIYKITCQVISKFILHFSNLTKKHINARTIPDTIMFHQYYTAKTT